jgi:hypothetical protein
MKLFTSILFLSFILSSCQSERTQTSSNDQANEVIMDTVPKAKPTPLQKQFVAIVNNLQIRTVPDKAAEVLGKIPYGETMLDLNEGSDFKEKIKLRGKVNYTNWKKISWKSSPTAVAIEGWIYGGGVLPFADLYQEVGPNQYERPIIRATGAELSAVLDISIEEGQFFYDGIVRYQKNDENAWVKHGKFEVKGTYNAEVEISAEISGNYEHDIPDGVFEHNMQGYEYGEITTINYENGKCLWSACMGSAEGEDYNYREENPKDCSFSYIQNKLNQVDGWN